MHLPKSTESLGMFAFVGYKFEEAGATSCCHLVGGGTEILVL